MADTADHFNNREPNVRATYDRLLATARTFGAVREEPKKTSIHLVNRTAFAGVATRKNALVLTIKAENDIRDPRIEKHEQVSARRWHVELRLTNPGDVDGQVVEWLRAAYEMSV
jgi:hypothetical protein